MIASYRRRMEFEAIHEYLVTTFPGTRVMEANGDVFFIHDPDRDLPDERCIPWATLVTSDAYDTASDLDRTGVFRLSIGLSKSGFGELFSVAGEHDTCALDVLVPHPVYGSQYWVCVLNPDTTWPSACGLLGQAHALAVRKYSNAEARRHR